MASYETPPAAVTLDLDDTLVVGHGHQQLALFNAHYDERWLLPIHVYNTAVTRPVAVLLRPGKTPSSKEARGHHRPPHPPGLALIQITIRGDGHYSRPEVMAWCEENGIGFIFGLPGNNPSIAWAMKPPMTSEPVARSNTNLPTRRREDALPGEFPEQGAPCLCPHRSHHKEVRYPLRHLVHPHRFARACL